MLITLRLDQSRLWRWHLTLIQQLEAAHNARVIATFSPATYPLAPALRRAIRLEAAIARTAAHNPFDPLTLADFDPWLSGLTTEPDIVIDLSTSLLPPPQSARVLVPLFNDQPGETVFWQALLDGKAPHLSLFDTTQKIIVIGQPAIESPHALRTSAAGVVTRLMTGLVHAANASQQTSEAVTVQHPRSLPPSLSLTRASASLLARKVTTKAQRIIHGMLGTAPHWAVAYRTLPADHDPLASGNLDPAAFTLLPDDGKRYYADPFLFAHLTDQHNPELYLFVEELFYATNKGIISVTTRRPDGTFSTPRPVLETPFHLSYPHVFTRDGEIWMLPEQSASGGLTLYRATRFPDVWEPAAQLIDEPLHDATLFEQDDRLWIAANVQGPATARWGSSWDSLSLFSAPTLLGPWTAHPGNPVLIDAATSRAAGVPIEVSGRHYRPVQDCSTGYGVALSLAEITTLTPTTFAQTVVGKIAFPASSGIVGPHTLNRCPHGATMMEVIDLFAAPNTIRRAFGIKDPATPR